MAYLTPPTVVRRPPVWGVGLPVADLAFDGAAPACGRRLEPCTPPVCGMASDISPIENGGPKYAPAANSA